MKKLLLILIALCTATIGYSQTFTDSNITYTVTSSANNTVRTSDYNSAGGTNVTIPSTVIDASTSITYTVTEIGAGSFDTNNLTSVIIPTSVTSIGAYAFSQNQNLINAPLHNGIVSIGENAFFLCALTSVSIPTSMTSIEDFTFANNNINSVTIPDNIISIENGAFRDNQLTNVTIPNSVTSIGQSTFYSNPITCVISEATTPPITNTTTTIYLDSFGNRSNINLTIPSGTASAYATAEWTGFNTVAAGLSGTFVVGNITYQINANPNNEVTVTDYNTAGGTVVNIPTSVTSGCTDFSVKNIGNYSFVGNNLTSVIIPDSVINIGEGAFTNNSINNLILGNNVESIGNWAFRTNNLTSVTIPDSVTSISSHAFRENNITNLVLGNGVENIGDWAFTDNDIASVTIPNSVLTIGDYAFTYSDGMTNLIIGNSVNSIGEFAFAMNPSLNQLTSVTIPSSVTIIGNYAFSIASLTDVFSESTTPPTITTGTNDTFGSIANRGTIHLHIPGGTGVMDAYVNDAGALWKHFNPVTQDALGVSDFELTNDIAILNTTDAITVTHSNSIKLEAYTIYSISGAKVTTGKENNIDTNYLSSGIYILKLDFNKGTVIKKFVAN